MQKTFCLAALLALQAMTIGAWAQSGPARLDGPAGKLPTVTTYADADGKQRLGKLKVAELVFPLKVFEETATGLLRVQHGGLDHWVASEDFKVQRALVADCNVALKRVTTGADRGANEGCVSPGTKK